MEMEGFKNSPLYYFEKKWYKSNNGKEDTVTGYSLRGGQMLKHAVIGIKETLQRGVNKTFEDTNVLVLDTRKNGVALDIEVQVMLKSERGVAMIKLYGPYSPQDKKENVIMVTKNKRSNEKFVTILAEKIVKPMIDGFVKEEYEGVKQEDNLCSICEKAFKSSTGVKSHMTRMHKGKSGESLEKEDKKEYNELCDKCESKVKAEKKYLALQLLRKHKKDQHPKNCSECDFKAQNLQELKRHERDVHGKSTISTSPPAKRKRNSPDDNIESMEKMDTEDVINEIGQEEMDVDEEQIKRKLSERMDKKVIEKQQRIDLNEKEWEEEKLARLKNKDEKDKQIKENEHKNNKIAKQRSKDRRRKAAKKLKKETKFASNVKEVPSNCKKFVNEGDVVYIVPGNGACGPNSGAAHLFEDEFLGPNLRMKMNHFLAEHYEVYKDIFPCSKEEPFVRRLNGENISFNDPEELKKFLKFSQDAGFMWSDSEDFKILSDMYQVKIKIITTKGLTDENPTVNWIFPDKNMSEVAELQDVQINDMVLLHEVDNHFDLIVAGDSQLVKYGYMSGRNDKIVEKEPEDEEVEIVEKKQLDGVKDISELQKEIEHLKKKNELFQKQYIECEKELRRKTEEAERLKSELKDMRVKESLENEIKATEDDLHKSINVEDQGDEVEFNCNDCPYQGNTKESLHKHIRLTHTMDRYKCIECDYQGEGAKDLYNHMKEEHTNRVEIKCDQCDYICYEEQVLDKHITWKHTKQHGTKRTKLVALDEENISDKFVCTICKYHGTGLDDLNTHFQNVHKNEKTSNCTKCGHSCFEETNVSKHMKTLHVTDVSLKCKTCGNEFNTKSRLMNHRKVEHPNTVAACKNYLEGQCDYAESCWWKHSDGVQIEIDCYFCKKSFDTKANVMMHRKKEHPRTVKQCNQFKESKCKHGEERCWFMHENKSENNSDFRKSMENPKNT